MTDQVRIRSVFAESFGGLSKRHLELPDAPMVVVYGPNEAGKSTFSELISWLLVGPATASEVIRRFASANEILKGSIAGTLRGDEFTASADFKVTPSGGAIAKASVRQYQLGGPLTVDQWHDRLGNLDQQAMAGIYRLWGQQLHDGGDADRELRRAGLGVLAESADPRELAKRLEMLSRPVSKLGHAESSFNSLATDLRVVAGQLREAEANVDQYRAVEAEIQRLTAQRSGLEDRRDGLERRRNLLEKVGNLDQLRDARESAERTLRSCAPVSPEWVDVVADMAALKTSVGSLGECETTLHEAKANLRQSSIAVGADSTTSAEDVLSKYSITAADTAPVATAVSNVVHTRSILNKAVSDHANALADSEAAADKLQRVLNDLETDSETLRRAKLDEGSRVQLGLFSKDFESALESVRQAEDRAEGARVIVSAARAANDRAAQNWQLTGADTTPAAWRSGASPLSLKSADSRWMWVLRAVIAAVAAASAVAGQWVLVGLALTALLVSWFARSRPKAGNVDTDSAAEKAVEARSELDAAEIVHVSANEELTICRERVAALKAAVADLRVRYGVNLDADPHLLEATLEAWVSALAVLDAAEESRSRAVSLEAELGHANETEAEAKKHLDTLLTSLGLPQGIDPESAGSQASDYIALVESAHLVRECEEKFSSFQLKLDNLLQPIAAEVDGWSQEKLMEVAKAASERQRKIVEARSALDTATRVLEGSLATDSAVRELFDDGISSEDRDREVDQIAADLETVNKEINELSAAIGLEQQRRDSLSIADRVADLRLSKGSLAESQRELAAKLATNRLAGVILRTVADIYERENQPDLVKRTGLLAKQVAAEWDSIKVKATGPDSSELRVQMLDGSDLAASALSTGARALLYLSLRLAMADDDGSKRRLMMPVLCDDPLVHLDDQRALSAMNLLAEAGETRQIVVFTCHQRTVEAAGDVGAELVQI